jgi:ankyrin repeat protein
MANLILIAQPDLIRATDKMGQAAIHIAAGIVDNTNLNTNGSPSSGSSGNGGRKSLEMVKLLVSRHGANVNARDHNEWTALHVACSAGNLRTVELLLAYGANVNAIALDGSTPLHYLVR